MYSTTLNRTALSFQVLSAPYAHGAIECIASTFLAGEPMTQVLKIQEQEFYEFAEIFIKKAVDDKLSIIALDPETDKVVGALICEDIVTDLPEGIEKVSQRFNPIFHLLGTLGERYKARYQVNTGELYHLFMGGVLKAYSGQGIIHQMTAKAEELARINGFIGAIGEATGPVSQHVYLNHLGYQELDAISYHEYAYEGEYIFKHVSACPSCKLIYKAL